jgi:hypothetical protein
MTTQQLSILNSLVTFAAEHMPGGLSEDEREVAQIVGNWVLIGMVVEEVERLHVKGSGSSAEVCRCPLGRNHV